MASKWKRQVIGSIMKPKVPGDPNYIKISKDIVLKEGSFLNLENEAYQLKNLQEGVEAGRVGADLARKLREGIDKTPFVRKNGDESIGFVLFQIVKIEKLD